MVSRVVVNGCSYMDYYATGNGHVSLGQELNIQPDNIYSLAQPGASNQRIIRTTLNDCYNHSTPTLYIIGITFHHRFELPVVEINDNDSNADKYASFSEQFTPPSMPLTGGTDMNDIETYGKLKLKFNIFSEAERIIELVYSVTSMIDSILRHGHTAVVFNTAEVTFARYKNNAELNYMNNYKQIIENFQWYSNEYQYTHGAKFSPQDTSRDVDDIYKHIDAGEHHALNEFLLTYIRNNNIIV